MAVVVRGVEFSSSIEARDHEDMTLDQGAIVSPYINGCSSDLNMRGVQRLMNALEMIVKNNTEA